MLDVVLFELLFPVFFGVFLLFVHCSTYKGIFLCMPSDGLSNKDLSCMDFLLKYSDFDLKVGHCNVLPTV